MATATTTQLHDKDGNIVLPQTDWSTITNKPNFNSIGNIPVFTGWTSDGVQFFNGAKNYNSSTVLAYCYLQIGNMKIVQIKGAVSNMTGTGSAFSIPKAFAPDAGLYMVSPTAGDNTLRWHLDGDGVATIEASSTGAITAQQFLPINTVYMTTNS